MFRAQLPLYNYNAATTHTYTHTRARKLQARERFSREIRVTTGRTRLVPDVNAQTVTRGYFRRKRKGERKNPRDQSMMQ